MMETWVLGLFSISCFRAEGLLIVNILTKLAAIGYCHETQGCFVAKLLWKTKT